MKRICQKLSLDKGRVRAMSLQPLDGPRLARRGGQGGQGGRGRGVPPVHVAGRAQQPGRPDRFVSDRIATSIGYESCYLTEHDRLVRRSIGAYR